MSKTKFKVGDKVRVMAGRYAGNLGKVVDVTGDESSYLPYCVELLDQGYWFKGADLELLHDREVGQPDGTYTGYAIPAQLKGGRYE